MKRIFTILLALALMLSMSVVATSPVAAATLTVNTSVAVSATNFWTIQDAIDAAGSTGDVINVAAGTYIEDLVIPAGKTGLKIVGAGRTVTTIKGQAFLAMGSYPLVAGATNIEILSSGVKLSGFTIEAPALVASYAFGVVLNGTGIEIFDNYFKCAGDQDSAYVAIQTWRGLSFNITGLKIYNNIFSGTFIGGGVTNGLYQGVFINRDGADGLVTITGNQFFGHIDRGIANEGSNAVISGNTITNTGILMKRTGIIVYDWTPARATHNVTVEGNTVSGFDAGILVGDYVGGVQVLGNIAVTGNTLTLNTNDIEVCSSAANVTVHYNCINDAYAPGDFGLWNSDPGLGTVNATCNWWGNSTGPFHATNFGGWGGEVSNNVLFTPWLMGCGEICPTQTNTDWGLDASAATGNVTAVAVGGDATTSLTVAEYTANPTGVSSGFLAGEYFFDVYLEGTLPGELVVSVNCTNISCTSKQLKWFDGTDWWLVTPAPTVVAGWLVFKLSGSSIPTLAQLTGTPFVLGSPVPPPAPVAVVPDCAGLNATYTIQKGILGDLIVGTTTVTVEFPASTGVPAAPTVTLDGMAVPAAWITVAGQNVTFYSPKHVIAPATVVIVIKLITNPPAGTYQLLISTSAPVDATPLKSAKYVIKPAYSTYKFVVDFSDTYPGLAEGFIPPFKYCGQPEYGRYLQGIGWATEGSLNFTYDVLGCAPPCLNSTMWFELKEVAFNSTTTFIFGTSTFSLTSANVTEKVLLPNIVPLAANTTMKWDIALHFDRVGDYEICFYVECTTPVLCSDPSRQVIAEICLPIKVHQDKEAYMMEFGPKWNLVSLPLVPFETDIDSILAAMNVTQLSQLKSIWNYDRCADEWFAWGNGQTSLTDIEDGKAYWVRMLKPGETGFVTGMGTLWVFGTYRPMPPAGPPAYPVCEGPNMVGFLPPWDLTVAPSVPQNQLAKDYLFNFYNKIPAAPEYGMIYGWSGTNWVTQSEPGATLVPSEGYWIVFERDGVIYP